MTVIWVFPRGWEAQLKPSSNFLMLSKRKSVTLLLFGPQGMCTNPRVHFLEGHALETPSM